MKDTGQPMRSAAPPLELGVVDEERTTTWGFDRLAEGTGGSHSGDDAPAPVRRQADVPLRLAVLGG
jgi:hypothetical protein